MIRDDHDLEKLTVSLLAQAQILLLSLSFRSLLFREEKVVEKSGVVVSATAPLLRELLAAWWVSAD